MRKFLPKITQGQLPLSVYLIIVLVLASWLAGPVLKRDAYRTDIIRQYAAPSREAPFGTDHMGRDILARVLVAARLDVGIAVGCAVLSFLVGTAIGGLSGYLGSSWDRVLMRLFDIWQAIPGMLLGLLVMTMLGKGIVQLISVIALINIPLYARMTRAEILPMKASPLVEAARLSLVPEWKILLVYVMPRALTSALAYFPVQAGHAVATTAGFGFIGLGVKPPLPEWGAMIADGMGDLFFLGIWWTVLPAGVMVGLTSLLFFNIGDWVSAHVGASEDTLPKEGVKGRGRHERAA